jgi:cytochrome c-type biogenesis protein CcmH/NrfF
MANNKARTPSLWGLLVVALILSTVAWLLNDYQRQNSIICTEDVLTPKQQEICDQIGLR